MSEGIIHSLREGKEKKEKEEKRKEGKITCRKGLEIKGKKGTNSEEKK